MDRNVYDILNDDLNDLISKLVVSDDFDDTDFREISEYKKEILNKKNINKKRIIEEQLKIIEEKAKLSGDDL